MSRFAAAPRLRTRITPAARMAAGPRVLLAAALAGVIWAAPAHAIVLTVNTTGDGADASPGDGVCETAASNGVCTLRAAIQEANALAGADTIAFGVGTGLQTITPATALPAVTTEVHIDGTTQPNPGGLTHPLIKLLGTGAPNADGLRLHGANASARGLIVVGFEGTGIDVNANGVRVAGNYVGVTETGAAQANSPAGFGHGGIAVGPGGAFPGTIIGGTVPADRNVISGNSHGVTIRCASSVRVQGNYVGLAPDGQTARPNTGMGVRVRAFEFGFACGAAADANLIGGTAAGAGNVIAGNGLYGIEIGLRGPSLTGNTIQGNHIGLAADGTTAVANTLGGIRIDGADPGAGAASGTLIGGTTAAARNVLAGSNAGGTYGIFIEAGNNAPSAAATTIQGNYIGLDSTGMLARGFGIGICLNGGTGTLVGGTAAGAGNVVSGNLSQNILLDPAPATLQGNLIGTNATGTAAVAATTHGVLVKAPGTLVGGTAAGARNVISGHVSGLVLSGSSLVDVTGVTVQGNYIGTDITGTASVPNTHGIQVSKSGFTIGGTTSQARNLISGNGNGVYVIGNSGWGPIASFTVIGNWIGLGAAGGALGNSQGIRIEGGVNGATIGGLAAGEANVIANNASRGVLLAHSSTTGVVVRGNSTTGNGHLGIDISDSDAAPSDTPGVTANDPLDADSGGNGRQNFPVLTSTISAGGVVTIAGTLSSKVASSYTIDFYANATCDALNNGEGDTHLGSQAVATDAGGAAAFSASFAEVPGKPVITATATGSEGTSEFSQCRTVAPAPVMLSGAIRLGSGPAAAPLANILVNLSGTVVASTVTGANGAYAFANLPGGGTYTVTPADGSYAYTPPSRTAANVTADTSGLDFSATSSTMTVTGVVLRAIAGAPPLAGVTVTMTGLASVTTVTAADGTYEFAGLPATGSYTLALTLPGYRFVGGAFPRAASPGTQVNDYGAIRTFTIGGQVRDRNDTGVPGVTLQLSGSAAGGQVTDADGRYAFTVDEAGTYTVTPALTDFVFTPPAQTFASVQADQVASFFVASVGTFRRYFAEGATGSFFTTSIALLNATGEPATATVRFLRADGQQFSHQLSLAGLARATVDPAAIAGLDAASMATVIESTQPLIADRTMRWDASAYGSHAETSIAEPLTRWYFAEGATTGGFTLFYLLQNPNPQDAQVEIRYLLPAPAAPLVRTYTVLANSRRTVVVNGEDPALDEADVSAVITSTNGVPIIAERAMYLDSNGQLFGAGHASAAAAELATSWFFAEGATGPFFNMFLLIANPNSQAASIEARYLLPNGDVITKAYTVAGNARFTIGVHGEDPRLAATPVSTTLTSTNGVSVLAERAMWWPALPLVAEWQEGHNSAGATRTGEKWGLADGEEGGTYGLQTYVLIANASSVSGQAQVTLIFEDGTTAQLPAPLSLRANSRTTVAIRSAFPQAAGRRFGVIVESLGSAPAQLVVERAMYNDAVINGGLVVWAAGTNVVGTRLR